jgi:two-component system, OmpR family, sensor histidine kinase VicK
LLLDAKNSGAKVKFLTDITRINALLQGAHGIVYELHHLDGLKGNFGVNESEYLASATLQEAKPIIEFIYSNVKAIVEQYHYLFRTLRNVPVPAEQRIKEIEEGIIPYGTKLVQEQENIIKEIIRLTESSNEFSTCATSGGMQFTYNYLFEVTNKLVDRYKKGEHKGIRYITFIDKDNVWIMQLSSHKKTA